MKASKAGSRPPLTPPLKWFGGKHYLAARIVSLFPRHLHYVEPFFGGGAVLLARDPDDDRFWLPPAKGVSEVANDIDGRLMNFWRVLQRPDTFEAFRRRVEAIPMSRAEWDEAHGDRHDDDPVSRAVAFFVDCRQSRSGMMRDFTSITRTRTRRRMNGNVSEWLGAVEGLADVHARLRRVLIEHRDGIDLIEREDGPGTLFYVDATYVHGTRTTRDSYRFEMTDDQHVRLVETLARIEGKAIVSMYRHPIYDALSEEYGWHREEIDIANNAAGGDTKRRMIECLWMNYDPPIGR
jgi:DNA adenine methylase